MKVKKVDLLDIILVVILILIFAWGFNIAFEKGGRPERVGLFFGLSSKGYHNHRPGPHPGG